MWFSLVILLVISFVRISLLSKPLLRLGWRQDSGYKNTLQGLVCSSSEKSYNWAKHSAVLKIPTETL